ncbi:MAG: HD domain-containing protein [Acidobacteria bacterium]|nr:HD domain-containing protein [Acidobacteriota bacterium]
MPERDPTPAARETVAVIDIGASAVRLVVAELAAGRRPFVVEEASKAVSLGKDTFSTGRIGFGAMEAALQALEGFKRIMDGYAVRRYRAVATSAVREAINGDTFLDRISVRTGLQVEIIDGSEESRLVYLAVRSQLKDHPALAAPHALLVEVGGGSADITVIKGDRPKYSGIYALGSVRMRQGLGRWSGDQERRIRMLSRHIGNVIGDIRREMPLPSATYMIAFGNDIRFAAQELVDAPESAVREVSREAFLEFCARVEKLDEEQLVDRYSLSPVDAETLVPALLVYRALLLETAAAGITVPHASLRAGVLVDMAGTGSDDPAELADFSEQVLASAEALGEKYRYDALHARAVANLATRLFDELTAEHGLPSRDRLLLEVAALLHDIGVFVGLRAHHKHTQYLIQASEIFGLSGDDRAVIANVARYHRRGLPQKAHLPLMSLDRLERVRVGKLSALLRIANALDAEHGQKIQSVRVTASDGGWVLDVAGAGDLTVERLAVEARTDLFREVFGRAIQWRGAGVQS